jgi:hypothetical protein
VPGWGFDLRLDAGQGVIILKKNLGIAAILPALALLCQLPAGAAASGAIFTTVVDGSIVNANVQYASKCDVYLDGGPGQHAPAGAAGLPTGYYYFQVTDPNGQTLLSTDAVSNRQFHVSSSGVIDAYTGTGGPLHPTGIDQDHPELGAITIRLANATCPTDYLDSPNNGGVYKVWVTPVADFAGIASNVDNDCGKGCYHGFVPSKSKTDNFKVVPTTATFCLTLVKQLVDNNGGIAPGPGWSMQVTDSFGVTNYVPGVTDAGGSLSVCSLVAGTYTVAEVLQPGFQVVGLKVNGAVLPAQGVYSFFWTTKSPDPFVVVFQNKGSSGPQ